MLSIAFRDPLGAPEGLGHRRDVVETIVCHTFEQRFYIVRAFSFDMLTDFRETLLT
jgi:hypothetical protein